MGIRTKINHKDSITLYVVGVNKIILYIVKRRRQNKTVGMASAIYTVLLTFMISHSVVILLP